jgi:F-type H+-transporting ATPase subunit gamma
MAGLDELKAHIESVKSTRKITRAMHLISASRSRKARRQLEGTIMYFRRIAVTLSEILAGSHGLVSPYLTPPNGSGGKGLYIVLSGDKGMAGGYNHNIVKLMDERIDKGASDVWVAGLAGRSVIARRGYNVDKTFNYPVVDPSVYRVREIAEMILERYLAGEYGHVHLIYTMMESQLKQTPEAATLLPLKPEELLEPGASYEHINLIQYEPSPEEVFDHLVPFYLKGVLYGAFVEAFACEQQARMYAMENASKSADDMIAGLSLSYNRARQAIITQEINEIVGGIPTD